MLDRLLESTVEAKSDQRAVLRVRYAYREFGGGTESVPCRGTGERVFRTVKRRASWKAA